MSLGPYVSLPVCLDVFMSLRLYMSFMYQCLYASLSLCLFASIDLCLFISMFLCLYVSMSLCLYVYVSLYLYISMLVTDSSASLGCLVQ